MPETLTFLGGTFDPVHNAHLIIARNILENLGLEKITFMIASVPPHKQAATAGAKDRLAMLRLALADEPYFDICADELDRPGPSYTVDTLERILDKCGPKNTLQWIIGADMLEILPKWHRVERLLQLARLIVAVRPPWDERLEEIFEGLQGQLPAEVIDHLRASTVRTPLLDISSTDIRQRVYRGLSIRYLVPDAVQAYIRDRALYRTLG